MTKKAACSIAKIDNEMFVCGSKEQRLKLIKDALDYLSEDLQHVEVTELLEVTVTEFGNIRFLVEQKEVYGVSWPKHTDYTHNEQYYTIDKDGFITPLYY